MNQDLRRKLKNLIRIGVSAGLILWLFSRFDLKGVWQALEGLPVFIWIAACCISLVTQVLSSIRWWILSKALLFPGPWSIYLGFYFVGMFFNLFLPTGVGGDIFKIHFLSREERRRVAATVTVLGDRFFGLAAMVFIGAVFILIEPGLLPKVFANGLLMASGVIVVTFIGMRPVLKTLKRMGPVIFRDAPAAVIKWQKPNILFPVLGLSVCLQFMGMGAVALMGNGMGIGVSPAFYFVMLPIVNILTMIPITFNGIGVREGAFVYFLGLKGIEPEPALALGLLFFSVQVAVSLMGGAAYALGVHRRSIYGQ